MTAGSQRGAMEAIRMVVDELAERLGRSVVVNDALVRQLYASRHFHDEDQARIRAMLQHDAGAEVVAYVLAQGVARWTRPGRIAGASEFQLLPRWCAPLRAQGLFLGTLMVIDARDDLTDAERSAIEEAASVIADHLAADTLAANAARSERDAVLRGVLSADPEERAHGAAAMRSSDFPDRPHLVVTAVEVVSSGHTTAQIELALRSAQSAVENSARIPGAGAIKGRHADFVQHWIDDPAAEALRAEASRIVRTVERALGSAAQCHVGIGAPAKEIAALRTAHRQATVALRAARSLPRFDGVALWSALGEYAALLSVADDAPPDSPASRALAAVRAHQSGPQLLQTLRTYLDEAGNAPRAAKALTLHRTSLYYRLTQIQEITGMDLDSGPNRLALHIQLRLDEIAGN